LENVYQKTVGAPYTRDVVINGVLHRAPAKIKRLEAELDAWYPEIEEVEPDGRRRFAGEIWNRRACALFAATLLEPGPGAGVTHEISRRSARP